MGGEGQTEGLFILIGNDNGLCNALHCDDTSVSMLLNFCLLHPDRKDRNGSGCEAVVVAREGSGSKGVVGGVEVSGEAEFPPTPLNHHMMLKKAHPIDHPRTPSPPITLSPSSPPHTQVYYWASGSEPT